MSSAIYSGNIAHVRFIPKRHSFCYPFFMWYLDLDEVENLEGFGRLFSVKKWAFSRFYRSDYLGPAHIPLVQSVRDKMEEMTGRQVAGKIYGLLNLRSFGLYFSPVNFYYGFDKDGQATHFLAEVSNTPWNERHYYVHYIGNNNQEPVHEKRFKVSPFNPGSKQTYRWKIGYPLQNIAINIGVWDERGHIFEATLRLEKKPFSEKVIRAMILKRPVMAVFIMTRIYYQALRIFLKKIPYFPYTEEERR